MSAKRDRKRAARRAAAPPRGSAPRPVRPLPWIFALLAGALLAGAWWATHRAAAPVHGPATAPVADAPWGPVPPAMGPVEAYAKGAALADSGHAWQSLPFLHRSVSAPGAPWQAWRAYGSALFNASMSAAPDPLADPAPGPRSSFERVALMRQALARIERAADLAGKPADHALAQLTRGQFLRTWGFPWDALHEFHQAGEIDPAWRDQGLLYATMMRDPLRPEPRP